MLVDHEVGQNPSARGPASPEEEFGVDLSGNRSSLPLTFLLFPCLNLRDVTSAHDKKPFTKWPFTNMGMAVNS